MTAFVPIMLLLGVLLMLVLLLLGAAPTPAGPSGGGGGGAAAAAAEEEEAEVDEFVEESAKSAIGVSSIGSSSGMVLSMMRSKYGPGSSTNSSDNSFTAYFR